MFQSKILAIHNFYRQPGGEDNVYTAERALLHRNGHTVEVYNAHNIRINDMSRIAAAAQTIWATESRQRLLRILQKVQYDVAHFHNIFLLISPSAYYACHETGVPVVQTLHNYRLICPSAILLRDRQLCEDCFGKIWALPSILHGCYRNSRLQTAIVSSMLSIHHWFKTWSDKVDTYICLSEFSRRKFIEGGLPADKIMVKPNFVYPDPGMRTENGRYAMFLGRFSPEKGLLTLLRAWQYFPSCQLQLVGDGPLMNKVVSFVKSLNIETVETLGRRNHDEVISLIGGASFLVFPSECYENFPLAIAEAFACGVPVIASRLGAMAEIVEDGRTGLHFTPGDPEDLAAKVEWAWTHPRKMREMGKEARREYEEKYTAERNYQMLMEIYQKAIEKN